MIYRPRAIAGTGNMKSRLTFKFPILHEWRSNSPLPGKTRASVARGDVEAWILLVHNLSNPSINEDALSLRFILVPLKFVREWNEFRYVKCGLQMNWTSDPRNWNNYSIREHMNPNDCAAPNKVDSCTSVGRAMHRYCRGHGFESRWNNLDLSGAARRQLNFASSAKNTSSNHITILSLVVKLERPVSITTKRYILDGHYLWSIFTTHLNIQLF